MSNICKALRSEIKEIRAIKHGAQYRGYLMANAYPCKPESLLFISPKMPRFEWNGKEDDGYHDARWWMDYYLSLKDLCGERMSRIVAFKADDDEQAEIEAYMKARHSKSLPELARLAFFAYMRQNKPGGHRTQNASSNGDGLHLARAGGIRPAMRLTDEPE